MLQRRPLIDAGDDEQDRGPPSCRRAVEPASRITGDAEGSIMPVIITAHIAHSSRRCGTSQTGVIIHALAPVIGPYMSPAIATIQSQHTSGTKTISTSSMDAERF
jgi:hypothetical protein